MEAEQSLEECKQSVLSAIENDSLGAEFQMAMFSSALLSYRKDSCVRPFPDFLQAEEAGSNERNLERLEKLFESVPSLEKLKNEVLSEELWKLLYWILKNRIFTTKLCKKNIMKDLEEITGQSSFTLEPDHVFEVSYHTNSSQIFDEQADIYGVKYGYHGSRMDNFYSIVSNGLQVHMMKNALYGDGIYLCEDLAVTMPYVSSGSLWKHSKLGKQASCVAVCELLDHPGVKCQVGSSKDSKKRATAKNTQLGEVPEKYFVVTSSNLMRIKYILMFLDRKNEKRKTASRDWICFRYPVASILFIYFVFLIMMGLWRSRYVQVYMRKYLKKDNFEND